MKNKIVSVVVVLFSLILLVCPLFTIGASAYVYPDFIYFNLHNPLNLPCESIIGLYPFVELNENVPFNSPITTIGSSSLVVIEDGSVANSYFGPCNLNPVNNASPPQDGVYLLVCALLSYDYYVFSPQLDVGSYRTYDASTEYNLDRHIVHIVDGQDISIDLNLQPTDFTHATTTVILYDMGMYFNQPTLQEQLNSYTGTWEDFRAMLDQADINGNPVFNDGLHDDYMHAIEVGETHVKRELNSKTTFQQFIDQLTEYEMTNAIDVLNNYVRNVFNDGIDTGYAQGLVVGDEQGYNRGTSENFGQNILGDTFNAPLNALNQWVLFETPGGIEVTMGGLFTAVIALAVLVIFLKMFAGG